MSTMTVLTDRSADHRVSREEFEQWRDERDDGLRYELLDGEILVTPSPVTVHQRVSMRLSLLLGPVVPEGLELLTAPYDVVLDDAGEGDTVLQPDLILARRADLGLKNLPKPPVLAIEILSPTTWRRDLGAKMAAYAAVGVVHYWVVAPRTPAVTVHRLGPSGVYAEALHVEGSQVGQVREPVAVEVVPADLVR